MIQHTGYCWGCGEVAEMQHVFIIGAKGILNYGGYETFIGKLLEQHENHKGIKYHIACKYNGQGYMDETKLEGAQRINEYEFKYKNAHCFKIKVPGNLGSAQAIYYDIAALRFCCKYIKKNHITNPVIYVLSSRIGPVMAHYVKKIHKFGGKYWHNPDGREMLRKKYSYIVRQYWSLSERLMVKYADLEVCDSKNIQSYIESAYGKYQPETTYIAYGADVKPSILSDEAPEYIKWQEQHGAKSDSFLVIGRFVPENNFEIMIREFMRSHTKRDFLLITNVNDRFLNELEKKLHFKSDPRIKFVGTVYDQELLKKIREKSFAYFHGHEVGGTNPSLLEALSSTDLNLLLKVGFNEEVAKDAALYWTKEEGNLSALIDRADQLAAEEVHELGIKAKERIKSAYSWNAIAGEYEKLYLNCNSVPAELLHV